MGPSPAGTHALSACSAQHAAVSQLHGFMLLQWHRSHQAGDRGDHCVAKGTSRSDVDPLQQIGDPDLAPVSLWKCRKALVSPAWASEISSLTPSRPRFLRWEINSAQKVSVSLSPSCLRQPSPLPPIATTPAREATCSGTPDPCASPSTWRCRSGSAAPLPRHRPFGSSPNDVGPP